METRDEQLILSVVEQDPELRRVYAEHVELEKRLAQIDHKGYLSTEEEIERKHLQKIKLAGKDRMMALLTKYR